MSEDIVLAAINAKWIHPSFALRLLKANLGGLASRCRILEFTLRQTPDEMLDPILAAGPAILGISVSIWNHKAALDLLKLLNEKWQAAFTVPAGMASGAAASGATFGGAAAGAAATVRRPFVVLGGPEASWLPRESEILKYADYVICGDGEFTFRELCEKLLNGIYDNSAAADTFPRGPEFIFSPPPDTAKLVSPYDLYTDEDLGHRLIYVESSRGCLFGCDFCLSAAERKIREFPLNCFLADMDRLLDRIAAGRGGFNAVRNRNGFRRIIKFLDRSFNANTERAVKIMEFFLQKMESENLPLCVHFEMTPFNFPGRLRDVIRRFPPGSLRIELGIQTLNPAAASLVNRPDNIDEGLEILGFLRGETCCIVHADLIAGLPGEGMESFGRGFDRLWLAMTSARHAGVQNSGFGNINSEPPLMEIQPGILKLLHGSPLVRHINSYGMIFSEQPPYEVMQTSAISPAEMDRVKNFARFWEILVNRKPFPELLPKIVPDGEPVFQEFMKLSDTLFAVIKRNWGIDRNILRGILYQLFSLS